MRAILIAMALALAGCQTTPPPKPEVVTVHVKIKEPCISKAPDRPTYKTGQGAYPGDKVAASLLAEDFEKADQYATQWETAAIGCLVAPSQP